MTTPIVKACSSSCSLEKLLICKLVFLFFLVSEPTLFFYKTTIVRDRGGSLGVGQIPWLFHNIEVGTFGTQHTGPLVSYCTLVRGLGIDGGPRRFMELETEGSVFHNELRKHPSFSHGESFSSSFAPGSLSSLQYIPARQCSGRSACS